MTTKNGEASNTLPCSTLPPASLNETSNPLTTNYGETRQVTPSKGSLLPLDEEIDEDCEEEIMVDVGESGAGPASTGFESSAEVRKVMMDILGSLG